MSVGAVSSSIYPPWDGLVLYLNIVLSLEYLLLAWWSNLARFDIAH